MIYDYLNIFKSRQRKNIKNERKKISEPGITLKLKIKIILRKILGDFIFL